MDTLKNYQDVFFFILVSINCLILADSKVHEFQDFVVTSISLVVNPAPLTGSLPSYSLEERQAICIAAQQNASLPPNDENKYILGARWYDAWWIMTRDNLITIDDHKHVTAINCNSYPSMYIIHNSGSLKSNVHYYRVFVEDGRFRYTFVDKTVTNMTLIDSSPKDHPFDHLDLQDRWNLCLAARNRIGANVTFNQRPKNAPIPDIVPKIYEMDYTKITAIACPTTPTLYLGFKPWITTDPATVDLRHTSADKVMQIILVDSELEGHL